MFRSFFHNRSSSCILNAPILSQLDDSKFDDLAYDFP